MVEELLDAILEPAIYIHVPRDHILLESKMHIWKARRKQKKAGKEARVQSRRIIRIRNPLIPLTVAEFDLVVPMEVISLALMDRMNCTNFQPAHFLELP